MPGGRPSTYKPEYAARVVELAKDGLSECEISKELGVPRTTMQSWADRAGE